ncbi:hypothetical protein N9L48_05060 [Psychrosphaera sp.]|nr:hypothetical protein [Psychrosphaera sp.]
MEKFKVPLIILLSIISIALFYQHQKIVDENSLLKIKLSERLVVLKDTSKSIIAIDDNCSEDYQNNPINSSKVTNAIIENAPINNSEVTTEIIESDSVVVNEEGSTEFETTQENRNIKTVPFEDQEIDYEWATTIETAVSDVFITSEILENFTLENVECRSSTCEVRMPKGQEDTFHQSVLVLLALEEVGIKHHSLKMSSDTEEGTVVFYFSKHES